MKNDVEKQSQKIRKQSQNCPKECQNFRQSKIISKPKDENSIKTSVIWKKLGTTVLSKHKNKVRRLKDCLYCCQLKIISNNLTNKYIKQTFL